MAVNDDMSIQTPITLKVEGNYLVGQLKHLSNYAVTGSNTSSNPKTLDNINSWFGLLSVSSLGIISMIVILVKTNKSKVK